MYTLSPPPENDILSDDGVYEFVGDLCARLYGVNWEVVALFHSMFGLFFSCCSYVFEYVLFVIFCPNWAGGGVESHGARPWPI